MPRADNLTTFTCRLSRNLGTSTSWNPLGLSRTVMGLPYLYLYRIAASGSALCSPLTRHCTLCFVSVFKSFSFYAVAREPAGWSRPTLIYWRLFLVCGGYFNQPLKCISQCYSLQLIWNASCLIESSCSTVAVVVNDGASVATSAAGTFTGVDFSITSSSRPKCFMWIITEGSR